MIIKKTYTVWYWQKFGDSVVRVGQTYETKRDEQKKIKSLEKGQYIGTTVKYFILDDDVA